MAAWTCPAPFTWRDDHIGASLPGGEVLFSTRRGGVSEGPFASLNLGRLTDDPGENVDVNRERLAAAVGAPRERFLYGRQVHEATVRRATEPPGPQRPHAPEDGQATALRRRPGARVRRRLPAGDARRRRGRGGAARRLARARGGDRGRGRRRRCASSGPRARSAPRSGRRRAAAATRSARRSTRPSRATTRASASATSTSRRSPGTQLAAAGVADVHDVGLCTMCADPALFFSHRRDGGVTGRQAGVVWRA